MSKAVIDYWEQGAERYRDHAYKFNLKGERYPFYETRRSLMADMAKNLPRGKLLDAGCGGAALVIHFQSLGWDCYGFDGASNMVKVAHDNLKECGLETSRVTQGDVTDLRAYGDASFDIVISAGVMEYLNLEEEKRAMAEAHRVLKPGGHLLVENINGLFDISTFNRFTMGFYADQVLPLFFQDKAERERLMKRIEGLVTNPDKPSRQGTFSTTRDQVFTRAEIPLSYGAKAKSFGFEQVEQGFYRYHAVPPLLFEAEPTLEQVPIAHELALSRHWIGNLMASGFVALLKKV
ncbi:MAG: class I SAM-dependent methyltransferase [Rhodospirillaceae bacterium]|nr:class I SAM-dependent methyltransferase [Rhodospirillaceae bacterium]